jgi:hypothetical protein
MKRTDLWEYTQYGDATAKTCGSWGRQTRTTQIERNNEDLTMETETPLECDSKLIQEGWSRRFSAEEPRLSEMKQFYESLGLEVLLVPGVTPEEEACALCFNAPDFKERYYTIYTRSDDETENRRADELFD